METNHHFPSVFNLHVVWREIIIVIIIIIIIICCRRRFCCCCLLVLLYSVWTKLSGNNIFEILFKGKKVQSVNAERIRRKSYETKTEIEFRINIGPTQVFSLYSRGHF